MLEQNRDIPIEIHEEEDYAVLIPSGYLNAMTGDQIDKICEGLARRGIHYFIINFGQTEMINTIGISILVGIIDKVQRGGGLVYFTELTGTNQDIFDALDLGSVAMIFPDNDSAIAHMRHDRETQRRAFGG